LDILLFIRSRLFSMKCACLDIYVTEESGWGNTIVSVSIIPIIRTLTLP